MDRRLLSAIALAEAVLIVLALVALTSPGRSPPPAPAPQADTPAIPRDATAPAEAGTPTSKPAPPVHPRPPSAEFATGAAPGATVLFGRVLDADGTPVRGALIWLRSRDAPGDDALAAAEVSRDASGRYAMPILTPGGYRLGLEATGFRSRSIELEVPTGIARLRQDFVLTRNWELRVHIDTPDGTPLNERLAAFNERNPGLWGLQVSAVATADPLPPGFPVTELAEYLAGSGPWAWPEEFLDGDRPRLPEGCAGQFELPEDRPMHISVVLQNLVLATERVGPGQEEVRIIVPLEAVVGSLCTVTLRVVDAASGAPVTGALVAVSNASGSSAARPVDEDGRIWLTQQLHGRFGLDVRAPGKLARPVAITLAPGATVDLGEIRLHEPTQVGFRFEGVAADAEIRIGLIGLDPAEHPALRPRSLRLGGRQAGALFEAQVPAGRHRLTANGGGAIGEIEFDTARLGGAPVTVAMHSAAALRVVPPALSPAVELRLVDGAGREVYRRWITWTAAFEVLVAPGSYVAEIARLDGAREQRTVSVGTTGADLVLR
jgi:protocatechuate 3,4-dioxygenase beta subunit